MTPQFVDFDFDGSKDIIVGTFDGTVFFVPRTDEGFQAYQRVKDSQDRPVLLSAFWNNTKKKWDNANRAPEGEPDTKAHCTSAVAVDFDGDKDLDLVLGAYRTGKLYVQINEGTAKEPSYTGVNHPIQADGKDLVVPGGLSSFREIDFNGDGLFDLVCGGSKRGGVFLYLNEGKPTEPKFGTPKVLIDPNQKISVKDNLPSHPQKGLHIDVVDFDNDDDLDLLVGGYSTWKSNPGELTKEQQESLAKLPKEIAELRGKTQELFKAKRNEIEESEELDAAAKREAIKKFARTDEEYTGLIARLRAANKEFAKLRPTSKRQAFVWLYRQQ